MKFNLENTQICVIGLGYVGLPLAVAFSEKYPVVGIDINASRVGQLNTGHDATLEVSDNELKQALQHGLTISTDINDARHCNVFVVTVPTPTDKYNRPVLRPMVKASESIAGLWTMLYGDKEPLVIQGQAPVVVYESTVYPGVTEEEMVPVLEQVSGRTYNQDFYCGYSPERINPGDKEHTVTKIL